MRQPAGSASFNRVATASFREKVASELRAAVIAGRMVPGTFYSAPALAQDFGVSATPVREAMVDLCSEGLVEAVRNKGYRVTEVSDKDLDSITDLRLMIEPLASHRAVAATIGQHIARLRELADRIVDGAGRGDLIQYVDADRDFHLTLLALSGNSRIVKTAAELRAQTRLYGLSWLAQSGKAGVVGSRASHHRGSGGGRRRSRCRGGPHPPHRPCSRESGPPAGSSCPLNSDIHGNHW